MEVMNRIINLPKSFVRRFDVYQVPDTERKHTTEVVVLKPSPLDDMEEGDEVQCEGRIYKVNLIREDPDSNTYDFIDLRSIV